MKNQMMIQMIFLVTFKSKSLNKKSAALLYTALFLFNQIH